MLNPGALLTLAFKKMLYDNSRKMGEEGFISPEIFIYFSFNSDSNLTRTHIFTQTIPKPNPNPNPNLNLKTANEKSADEDLSFLLYSLLT